MKYIGIDFGSKRIGIAVSDAGGKVAFPKVVLDSKDALKELIKFCKYEEVEHIVMGESKDFNMKDNPIAELARNFGEELASETALPLSFYSEMFSSHQAAKEMHHAQTPRGQILRNEPRSPHLDASSATIMLQSFLDSR